QKKLDYLSFGMFAEDADAIRQRITSSGLACEPHPVSDGNGIWLRDPDGLPLQLVVAENLCPTCKPQPTASPAPLPGKGAAPARSAVQPVRPRRMSHVLRFTPDVPRMIAFYSEVL